MSAKNQTILVVDDDNDILKIVKKILEAAGFAVLTAQSPEEARKILEGGAPHAIISDLNMEPENGYDFIIGLKKDRQHHKIPVIVLSAVNEFSDVKRAISLGVDDYVIKPLHASMLLRKIRKVLFNKELNIWTPPKNQEPQLSAGIECEISEIGETGYRLNGPFKLTSGVEIKTENSKFASLGLTKYAHRSSLKMKKYLSNGKFSNDVTFFGINEEGSSKIRLFVKGLE